MSEYASSTHTSSVNVSTRANLPADVVKLVVKNLDRVRNLVAGMFMALFLLGAKANETDSVIR